VTRLQPALLAYLGLAEPDELLARLYVKPWTPDELAGFAPVVMRLAAEGDGVAHTLLEEGARALAGLVRGAAAELRFPEGPAVVLLGGCALSGPPYQPLVERALHATVPGVRIVAATYSPSEGAALNALRQGGVFPLPKLA
jgi:glucosamine kinase